VKVPAGAGAARIVVLANMSPDNQLEMLGQCGISDRGSRIVDGGCEETGDSPSASSDSLSTIHNPQSSSRFVIADTMDLWIEIASERLHEVLPQLDLFVLNEGEARELAGTSNLVKAGRILLKKGPRHVVIKLGEFGAMLFSSSEDGGNELFRASAWPLEAVADPTGAGDTFLGAMAGYLAAQGAPPYSAAVLRQAVVRGSMLASFTCEAFSTRRLEELSNEDLIERLELFRAATHW
jgi:cytidine kinase